MLDQSEKRNDRFSIEIVAQLVKRVLPRKFDRYFLETVYIYIYISVQLFSKLRQKAYVIFPPRKLVVLKEESECLERCRDAKKFVGRLVPMVGG